MGYVNRIAVAVTLLMVTMASAGRSDESTESNISLWMRELRSDSYSTRSRAQRSLVRLAAKDRQANGVILQALVNATQDRDVEVSVVSRELLSEIRDRNWRQLTEEALRAKDVDDLSKLPGWSTFAELCGADRDSRRLFRQICIRHAKTLQLCFCDSGFCDGESVPPGKSQARRLEPIDFSRWDRDAVSLWSLILLIDCSKIDCRGGRLSWQLAGLLRQSGHGPADSLSDDPAFRRLISAWLLRHAAVGLTIDRIRIAMRYRCHDAAIEICRRVLQSDKATVPDRVVAMMAITRLASQEGPHESSNFDSLDLASELRTSVTDTRVFHRYRSDRRSSKSNRTQSAQVQLGDVAMAMLLYHHGVDPREAGYEDLQADPLLVFRDVSLGFSSESARQAARSKALGLLQKNGFNADLP